MNSLSITDLALIVLLAPAAAAALIGIIGLRGLRSHSHWLAIAGVAIALVAAGKLFRDVRSVPEKDQATVYRQTHVVYEWFRPQIAGGTELRWFNVEFRVDQFAHQRDSLVEVLGVAVAHRGHRLIVQRQPPGLEPAVGAQPHQALAVVGDGDAVGFELRSDSSPVSRGERPKSSKNRLETLASANAIARVPAGICVNGSGIWLMYSSFAPLI